MISKCIRWGQVGLFADGAAVRCTGEETFRVAKRYVDGMLTVTTDEICQAIKMGFNDTRCVMEPAGALAIAGMRKYMRDKGLVGHTVRYTVLPSKNAASCSVWLDRWNFSCLQIH